VSFQPLHAYCAASARIRSIASSATAPERKSKCAGHEHVRTAATIAGCCPADVAIHFDVRSAAGRVSNSRACVIFGSSAAAAFDRRVRNDGHYRDLIDMG